MKIELKDLCFIDTVAISILSSRLTSTEINLTREQLYSLANSAYNLAEVVYDVRKSFKEEHHMVDDVQEDELYLRIMKQIQECHCEPKEKQKLAAKVKEKEPAEELITPLEVKAEDKPKKRGRPKTVLKVNTILNKKTK